MNYRNRKVLEEAKHHPCQGCGADDGTIVAAHSNLGRHGKGMSMKAHDCFVAYLCHSCHSWVDQGNASRVDRTALWMDAHQRSVALFSHLLDGDGKQLLAAARKRNDYV